jgi:amino acid adenylation domain-containing protein
MKLFELANYISLHNINVKIGEGKLHVSGATADLTPAVVAAIKEYKSAIAAYCESRTSGAIPASDIDVAPLSFAQNRLYFLYLYDKSALHFNLPVELEMAGDFDPAAFQSALTHVIGLHKIYKTTYFLKDGVSQQRHDGARPIPIAYHDLSAASEDACCLALENARTMMAGTPFDLETELPVRISLLKMSPASHRLLMAFHHIAADEWSIHQLLSDLARAYPSARAGETLLSAPPAISYLDYAVWQNKRHARGAYEVSRSFWKHQLADAASVLELPLDKPRPPSQTFGNGLLSQAIPAEIKQAASAFCRGNNISEFSFFLSVYYVMLYKLSGATDMIVGTDIFGREHAGLKNIAGFFVNQLALRCRFDPTVSVLDHIKQVNEMVSKSLDYQDMPFDKLVEEISPERDAAYSPIFQVKFLYHPTKPDFNVFDGVQTKVNSTFSSRSQYDLTLTVFGDQITAYYNNDLFHPATVERWMDSFIALAKCMLSDPAQVVSGLLQARLLEDFSDSARGAQRPVSIEHVWSGIEAAIAATPAAIAIQGPQESLTYAELDQRLQTVAANLLKLGVKPQDRIGIFLERSPEMVIAIVATLRIGAVFVPLDASYPPEHINYTLDDSGATIVISDDSLSDSLHEFYGAVLNIHSLLQGKPTLAAGYPSVDNEKIAYLLYTSGSTGRPKGVLVRRGALANLCDWYIDFASITSESKVILMIPIGFDASIKNIFSALMAGGTLVLAPTGIFDPDRLLAQIDQCQVSVLNAAPSAFYALVRQASDDRYASLRSLKLVALGGEPLKSALLDPWLAAQTCHATLANIYGPTECTDISIAFKATAAQWLGRAHAPIGRPIQNTMAYIVDDNLALCLHGVAGELVIAGRGVAAGYQNDAQLASSPFIMSAYSPDPVYRTGDMCKYDADGNIVFLGRRDGQIKIRGKRVERDEIAHHIVRMLPGSLVSIQLYANAGVETLLAFVEGRSTDHAGLDIRGELKKRLPRHMVPAQVYFVDNFPLSPNGKVSGSALLAQVPTLKAALSQVIRPLNDTEQLLAGVWSALLGEAQIEQDADFFTLGGDSILSIQVVAALRALGIEIEVADIFKYPTLEQLAEFIVHNRHGASPKTARRSLEAFALVPDQDRNTLPDGLEDAYPLTPLQLGMFIQTLSSDIETVYHDVFSFELTLDFVETLFTEAIQTVVSHQPILRTGFDFDSFSIPLQLVHANVPANILVYDITSQDSESQNRFIAKNVEIIRSRSVPPEGPSLIRFSIFKKSSDCIQLVIDAHHAILDGWSMATVQRQIFEHYSHLKDGKELADIFSTGGIRFVDYVAQQIEDVENIDSREFWDAYCATSGSGAITGSIELSKVCHSMSMALDHELMHELKQVADYHGIQVKTLLVAAHAFTIQSVLGQRSLLTGISDNGRPEVEGARNVVGLFLNVLPVHCDLGAKTWLELGRALQHADADMKPHRRFPFANILQRNHKVKVDTLFTYTNFHVARQLLQEEKLKISFGEQYDETDFALSTLVSGNLQDGYVTYLISKLALPQSHIRGLLDEFHFALKSMVADFNAAIPLPSRLWVPAYAFEPRPATRQGEHFYLKFSGELNIDVFRQSAQQAIFRALAGKREYAELAGLDLVVLRTWTDVTKGDAKHEPLIMAPSVPQGGLLDVVHYSHPDGHFVLLHVSPQLLAAAQGQSCVGDILSRYLSHDAEARAVAVKTSACAPWRAAETINGSVDFWRTHLEGAPALLELPADRPRPAVQSHAGDNVALTIPAELAAGLRNLAQRHGATLFMTLLSGWSILLARMSGQDDVVIGTPVANRQRSEIEALTGFFVNTLALRVQLGDDPSVAQLLAQVKASTLAAYSHQDLPFEQVVEALRPSRSMSYSPIFQVMLSLNRPTPTPVESSNHTPQLDLSLSLSDQADAIGGTLEYASDLFERSTIERLVGHFQQVLTAMVADEQQQVSALPLLSPAQRQQLLVDFNDTATPYPQDQLVHELFEVQAAAQPDAIALVYEDQQLTYGHLNRRANQLAHHLLAQGVLPDTRVAVYAERGPDMVIGLMAILKAGAAYVPLDPGYPRDRLDYILRDSAPSVILTQAALKDLLPGNGQPVFLLDDPATAALLSAQPQHDPAPARLALSASNLAYIIYTSGSTGQPKGVANTIAGLRNRLLWGFGQIWTKPPCTAFKTNLGFADSVTEILGTLLAGGTLVTIAGQHAKDPEYLLTLIDRHRISSLVLVPSLLACLLQSERAGALAHLDILISSGESLPRRVADATLERFAALRLFNFYGSSEVSADSTAFECSLHAAPATGSIIGRPIANTQVYLLDGQGQPVPLGVAGEIHIGGAGVARGYLNRPELTAERFLPDPFSANPEAIMYKTGDLGRWLADGNIEYLGRNDFQVKIRGFRIELGEIEARLAACAGVREALVLAREDIPGDQRLVAYFVPAGGAEPTPAELRAQLAADLPDYMLPAAFMRLDALPLTPNGKLDRKALPIPGQDALSSRVYEAPTGPVEPVIAAIWQDLLGVPRVGRHDNFFELGGHSLLAVQMVSRLRQRLDVELPLRALFTQPTLAGLAAVVDQAGQSTLSAIPPADRNAALPLSWAQQRLWFLDQLDHAAGAAYHMPAALRLSGTLDRDALRATLDRIVARHEGLRTTFARAADGPVQVIAPSDCGFALAEHDLRDLDQAEREQALARLSAAEAAALFDLAAGPLIRGQLIRLADDEHILLVTQHHVISDGWSVGVLVKEVSVLYAAFSQGQPDPLPPLTVQYADYAFWQRQWLQGDTLHQQVAFWRTHLEGAPALLELPADRPRPVMQSYAGGSVALTIPAELAAGLRSLAQRHGATLFMTLLSGWSILLARMSGQDDIVIGTPVANRQRTEIEALIGFFVNTLALRVQLGEDPSVAQLLDQVKASTVAAYSHQDLPFEQVVEALSPPRSMRYSPIFQVMLSLNNVPTGGELSLPGLTLTPVETSHHTTQFDLSLSLSDQGDAIGGALEYASDLFDRSTIERLSGHFQQVLAAMVADEQQRVSALPLLSTPQRRQLLEGFNDTAVPYPQDQLIHELFEAQAAAQPDAVAVVYQDRQLTYDQLNRRANQLAHHLLALGVQPDDRVAICAERSLDMIVGLIGILKAGAAYVPLDPGYPADRLAYMLADSAPVALLTQAALVAGLPAPTMPAILLDADAAAIGQQADSNPGPALQGLTSRHLAYVIYTSGSTGMPKGVMVEQRSVLNLWQALANTVFARVANGSRVTLNASISFDASLQSIVQLLSGHCVVVVPQEIRVDGAAMIDFLHDQQVDVFDCTPTQLEQLSSAGLLSRLTERTRTIMVGGEALSHASWNQLRQAACLDVFNVYGPTECTVDATCASLKDSGAVPVIGRPLANTAVYILDAHLQPVPLGVTGELYIGGAGVARGYLDRPELNAERFLADPFSSVANARMYKTGDLGRWLPDGNIEYQGRNDFQVKIRGFRIELGEIEAGLAACAGVRDALVLAREDVPGDKRLVAYLVAKDGVTLDAAALRSALAGSLPEQLLPSAYVVIDSFPLTANGKLDRSALPGPEDAALVASGYEEPVGATEQAIARIWEQLLGHRKIGRNANFFELGGHSLLVITLIEQLRESGRVADVRTIFAAPTLSSLAAALDLGSHAPSLSVPPNLITADGAAITPDMVPLAALDQEEIDLLVSETPSGLGDIQDIYRLAPLQEGILFHHLLDAGSDAYVMRFTIAFDSRARLDGFLAALQTVISRHDILRSSVHWTGLRHPVQIVHRQAPLPVHTLTLDGSGDALAQFQQLTDPQRARVDLQRAPLLAAYVAACPGSDEWMLALLTHHIVSDHLTVEFILNEIQLLLHEQEDRLPPALPYRNFIAQVHSISVSEHEAFFRSKLADIDAPTAPFGLLDVQGNGNAVSEAKLMIADELALRIRALARRHGVTSGSLFHTAWAQVLARCTGRSDVVFGTVLSGRLQGTAGADQVLGMFINSLPIRISLAGKSVSQAVRETLHGLTELLGHEQASLALAQRCSGVPSSIPLFSTLLNFRHSKIEDAHSTAWTGIRPIRSEERTNYPITVSVDDLGLGFSLTTQCAPGMDAKRINDYLNRAVESLAQALADSPERAMHTLAILPERERQQLLVDFNSATEYPQQALIHQRFEAQAAAQPDAIALVYAGQQMTYDQLNRRANQLAHHLLALGVQPDDRVALCVERSLAMIVGLIGILKAGAAYVPLDPGYPADRLAYMLADSAPVALLTQAALVAGLPALALPVVLLDADAAAIGQQADSNPDPAVLGLTSGHLAYVIYTSGSTGMPKGVLVEHANVSRLFAATDDAFQFGPADVWTLFHSVAFDFSVWEIWGALAFGGRLVVVSTHCARSPDEFYALLCSERVTVLNQTPSAFRQLIAAQAAAPAPHALRAIVFGGEALELHTLAPWTSRNDPERTLLINMYGITEITVHATYRRITQADIEARLGSVVGTPLPDLRTYILDAHLEPVPLGVTGELFIGGAGVARGYLNRPELNAERFLADPFSSVANARMYKTGDLGRWLPDGSIEYQGRNDFQVKIRGFRIELGEIEARLAACAGVREAVVIVREDVRGDKRLVAYLVAQDGLTLDAAALRTALAGVLADYMIPSAFVTLDSLPLTVNGKLDRRALPAPDQSALVTRAYETPLGDTETALAEIWQDLLDVPRVGRHDHFFEMGGHSLLVLQLVVRIRENFHVELPLKSVFDAPTLLHVAEAITAKQFEIYLGEDLKEMQESLNSLSKEDLLKILAEENQ